MTGATSLRAKSSTVARSAACSSLKLRSMSALLGFDDQQGGAAGDSRSGACSQLADDPVHGRGEGVLHLHRLDDGEALTCGDALALGDVDDRDGAGHG